jgi:hypothetical protein
MPIPFCGAHMAPRDVSIPDLNWEQLEQASRLGLTAPQRSQLVKSLNAFVMERTRDELAPSMPAVRCRLQDLGRYAQTLARLLNDDSTVGSTAMSYGFPFEQVNPTTLIRDLWLLDLTTKMGLNHLADLKANAGHPDRRRALDPLIRAWHGIYRQAGGRGRGCYKDVDSRTYRGRFLDLLDKAMEQAATILTTEDTREPSSLTLQRKQERARQHLRNMIYIPRVTLAKRIEKVLTKHPS